MILSVFITLPIILIGRNGRSLFDFSWFSLLFPVRRNGYMFAVIRSGTLINFGPRTGISIFILGLCGSVLILISRSKGFVDILAADRILDVSRIFDDSMIIYVAGRFDRRRKHIIDQLRIRRIAISCCYRTGSI